MFFGIAKAIEEPGEFLTELGKLIAYPDGDHPDGEGHLYERVQNEGADAIAAITWFILRNPEFNNEAFLARIDRKMIKYSGWAMAGVTNPPPCAKVEDVPPT